MTDTENPFAAWEHNFRDQMLWLRETRGMTQTDLAKLLKNRYKLPFHQQTIQRIESGDRPVRLNEAHLIAKVLDVDLDSMTAEGGPPSDREMRYAIDRLRGQAGVRLEEVRDTLGEWADAVDSLGSMVISRGIYDDPVTELPAIPESELDAVTRWGMEWAINAQRAFKELFNAYLSLAAINGEPIEEERRFIPSVILGEIARWPEMYSAVVEGPRSLAASAYPGSDDGQH